MIESTLKIARYCPLVIQGFSNFLGLFQGIMANPVSCSQIVRNSFAAHRALLHFSASATSTDSFVPQPLIHRLPGGSRRRWHLLLETPKPKTLQRLHSRVQEVGMLS